MRVKCIRVRVIAEWIREDGYGCVMGWQGGLEDEGACLPIEGGWLLGWRFVIAERRRTVVWKGIGK